MLTKIFNKQNLKKIEDFFNSYYYPAFLFVAVLLTHTLALDLLGLILTISCFIITTLICEDLRPAVPFILMFPYVVSTQNSPGYGTSEYYSNPFVIYTIVALGVLLVLSIAIRVIVRKEYKSFFDFKNKKLLLGFLLLIPCYLLAGIFSGFLDFNSIFISIVMICLQPIIYIIFSSGIHSKEDNILYLARVSAMALILMCLEIAFVYALKYEIGTPLDNAWKGNIIVGSVVSNSAGEFIVILMPFLFYLAYKEKHGFIYYIIAALSVIAIYFTLSRASLLFGVPTFILGSILLCFKGNNKKLYRALSLAYLIILIALVIALYKLGYAEKLFKFFEDAGFSNRGRFKIWSYLLEQFKSFPIFGVGFSAYMQSNPYVPQIYQGLAHNTLIQFVCSTGIVGTLLFGYHAFEAVKTLFTKITFRRLFLIASIALFLLISLLDQIYFFPNFTVIFTLFLTFAEKDVPKEV